MHANLAEENRHEVVVNQEGLREVWIVIVEEERGKAQRDVLLWWSAEGRTQQLHPRYGNEESSAAGNKKNTESNVIHVAVKQFGDRAGKDLLHVQLFVVLAHSSGFGRQGVEHHGRVDEIFFHALEPRVQLLKPHQLSSIWGKEKAKHNITRDRGSRGSKVWPDPSRRPSSCDLNPATTTKANWDVYWIFTMGALFTVLDLNHFHWETLEIDDWMSSTTSTKSRWIQPSRFSTSAPLSYKMCHKGKLSTDTHSKSHVRGWIAISCYSM